MARPFRAAGAGGPHQSTEMSKENDMATNSSSNEIQLGAQGRLVIPMALRKALHLKQGDRLVVRQAGESLVLERREAVVKRLRGLFAHIPDDVSLVDELIAERREEAAREDHER